MTVSSSPRCTCSAFRIRPAFRRSFCCPNRSPGSRPAASRSASTSPRRSSPLAAAPSSGGRRARCSAVRGSPGLVALALGFSDSFWSQAVIADVYSLNAAFCLSPALSRSRLRALGRAPRCSAPMRLGGGSRPQQPLASLHRRTSRPLADPLAGARRDRARRASPAASERVAAGRRAAAVRVDGGALAQPSGARVLRRDERLEGDLALREPGGLRRTSRPIRHRTTGTGFSLLFFCCANASRNTRPSEPCSCRRCGDTVAAFGMERRPRPEHARSPASWQRSLARVGFPYEYFTRAIFRPYPLIVYGVLALWLGVGLVGDRAARGGSEPARRRRPHGRSRRSRSWL